MRSSQQYLLLIWTLINSYILGIDQFIPEQTQKTTKIHKTGKPSFLYYNRYTIYIIDTLVDAWIPTYLSIS